MPPFSCFCSKKQSQLIPNKPQTNRKEIAMRTKITLYGEIAGNIWMPAVECSKEFHLELIRIPRTSNTRILSGHRASLHGDHVPARCPASPHK